MRSGRVVALLISLVPCLAILLIGGCQRAPATSGAPAASEAPAATVAAKPVAALEPAASPAEHTACAAGEGCEGNCKQWDQAAAGVARREVPPEAKWLEFQVSGMHCGGCERRVIANLGALEGVVTVEADAELGKVRVAALPQAKNVASAAVARIEQLGYRVAK